MLEKAGANMKRTLPPAGTVEVAPSILSADFARLGEHIAAVEPEVRMLHLDVMDGHFVPNLTIGPPVVRKIRRVSGLYFDVHIMVTDPLHIGPMFIAAGADGITFHLEANDDPREVIRLLREKDVAVGISIKPATPVAALRDIIAEVDMVLLMTVEPGFGGQSFIPESLDRARELRAMLRDDQRLEVDGGINLETAPEIVNAGADTLVAGSYIFDNPEPAKVIHSLYNVTK